MPVGPLMIEHRLIERMISLLEQHVNTVASPDDIDLALIEQGIDFSRTYSDHCHHGKEEDYLFKALAVKPLSIEHKRILEELMEEHTIARAAVRAMADAKERAGQGDPAAYGEIADLVRKLAVLYPSHIEKEDKHFFIPVMSYFTPEEQEVMLKQFAEFDQKLIHEKYGSLVEKLETAPAAAAQEVSGSGEDMAAYVCIVCGYVYDPAVGHPEGGIPSGTSFADLPADWVCPLCGSGKDMFKKVD